MLARYYLLPTNDCLSLCTVESGSSSHNYPAIYSAYSSLACATTRLMVRACAQLVLWEYQHALLIVQTPFFQIIFCLTLFCLPSLLLVVNCACAHKMVGRYDGLVPAQDLLFALILWYVAKTLFRS